MQVYICVSFGIKSNGMRKQMTVWGGGNKFIPMMRDH